MPSHPKCSPPIPDPEQLAKALLLAPDLDAQRRIAGARGHIGTAVARLAEAQTALVEAARCVRASRSVLPDDFRPGEYLETRDAGSADTSLEGSLAGSLTALVAEYTTGDGGEVTRLIARLGELLTETNEDVAENLAKALEDATPATLQRLWDVAR